MPHFDPARLANQLILNLVARRLESLIGLILPRKDPQIAPKSPRFWPLFAPGGLVNAASGQAPRTAPAAGLSQANWTPG